MNYAASIYLVLAMSLATSACTPKQTLSPASPGEAVAEDPYAPPVERELAGGQVHEHPVSLRAGQFVFAQVDQLGIDVRVEVHGPDERLMDRFDSVSGPHGSEAVVFFSQVDGPHVLRVAALDGNAPAARYRLQLMRVEAAASERGARVDQLFSPWARKGAPGAAVAVVQDGVVVHEGGYGSANLEHGAPITPTTRFNIASTAKQVTAFAVMLLADQQKLSLDDDIRKHIPELPDLGHAIRVRDLVYHTSGLRSYRALLATAGWRLEDLVTRDYVLDLLGRQQALDFQPGTEVAYSNTNFFLLAEIVARVTGRSFAEWTRDQVFAPLGMDNSQIHDDIRLVIPERAMSYTATKAGFGHSGLHHVVPGATNLYTAVRDMARWATNLDTGEVGGERVRGLMHQRGTLRGGSEIPYAAGLIHGQHRGLATVWHGGSDASYRSIVVRYPEQRFAVVLMSNFDGLSTGQLSRQIAELYLESHMIPKTGGNAASSESDKSGETGEAMASDDASDDASDPTVLGPAGLDAYVGPFSLETGMLIAFVREGDGLAVQVQSIRLPLVRTGEHQFRVRGMEAGVVFEKPVAGRFTEIQQTQGAHRMRGKRVQPIAPSADVLAGYVGVYHSEELATRYAIEIRDGTLIARHARNETTALSPAARDAFTGDQWYLGWVRFVRDDSGKVGELRVSNGRMREVRFVRMSE